MPRILLLSNPRSGSTHLAELLSSHPDCAIEGELLNSEVTISSELDPLTHVETNLARHPQTFVGFKVFPEQIFGRQLNFHDLLRHTGTTHVIVLWRENVLDTLASLRIAEKTNIWYTNEVPNSGTIQKIEIDPLEISEMYATRVAQWEKIGSQWPIDVQPIYIKYEDLVENSGKWLVQIFAQLSLEVDDNFGFFSGAKKQNPATTQQKVLNWHEIEPELREIRLNVKEILSKKMAAISNQSSFLPPELSHLIPDREPQMPPGGRIYRVAEPFMPAACKQNVFDAVSSGSVSSAGFWPKKMAAKLKSIFGLPVAQPCSNGFTALMLALQAAQVKNGDEVILPSLTMVAVANAVKFVGASPIFVDSCDDNYNPNWPLIEDAISEKTRAIILTHTYGQPNPQIEKISEECHTRQILLIEDISECVGVKIGIHDNGKGSDRLLGTFGDFACASLYVNKMVHGGDGGFVLSKHTKFTSRLTSLVNHGFTPAHHFVHFEVATNSKINGLGAAMACGCLDNLDRVMEHRKFLASTYRSRLTSLPIEYGVKTMPICGALDLDLDTPWVFGVECESKKLRMKLRNFLAHHGIETRDYFFPLHLQPIFYDKSCQTKIMKNSVKFGSTGFYLPSHTNLTGDDLNFICDVMESFFRQKITTTTDTPSCDKVTTITVPEPDTTDVVTMTTVPRRKLRAPKLATQIAPNNFAVEVRGYNASGDLTGLNYRRHLYISVVKLGLEAEEILVRETWDDIQGFISRTQSCIKQAKSEGLPGVDDIEDFFRPYLNYFKSNETLKLEPTLVKPWLQINLSNFQDQDTKSIPTTTDHETLQLLVWLVTEMRPTIVWEIGCWLGHATCLMAAAAEAAAAIMTRNQMGRKKLKIFACDAFRWQNWMRPKWTPPQKKRMAEGESFKEYFEEFTHKFQHSIQPIDWPYDIEKLPKKMTQDQVGGPHLIFLDMTQEAEDLEFLWEIMKPHLKPNETIIVFNGVVVTSMSFFVRHSAELVAMAKPNTIAKAFRYVGSTTAKAEMVEKNLVTNGEEEMVKILDRKLNFVNQPNWHHHHDNIFGQSMKLLHDQFHDENAPILFIAAVEETICDHPELMMDHPWVGVIHSVIDLKELFYTPDLRRLCSPQYEKVMKMCRGLFTLTQFQANYLRENLKKYDDDDDHHPIPIQSLVYPLKNLTDSHHPPSMIPSLWRQGRIIDLIMIGSFARNFDLFFEAGIPSNLRKVFLQSDTASEEASKKAPKNVHILPRLGASDYEKVLEKSIIFLALKYDGAANTLIIECVARNVPIVVPNFESCIEYLGPHYPLLYDPKKKNFEDLITLHNVQRAVNYLEGMDKRKFDPENFKNCVNQGIVFQSLPPWLPPSWKSDDFFQKPENLSQKFDVTISICSYKRTHHLPQILESLWSGQDFEGSLQIMVWNNNDARIGKVRQICGTYISSPVEKGRKKRSLELINSTQNYFCAVRLSLAPLMKSDRLLICDDDILPNKNFVKFFMTAHQKHPQDILCLRGHKFEPHALNPNEPTNVWRCYENLRFCDDDKPEQLIHFVHADACLIPKKVLEEVASVGMAEADFTLVDDYWMSFVASHRFGRKLRKLSFNPPNMDDGGHQQPPPLERAFDSDQIGLALHTQPEVQDARIRLYIHHMLQGWPSWSKVVENHQEEIVPTEELKNQKWKIWTNYPPFIGYNISSRIQTKDIQDLSKMGVHCVRIGAVGIGRKIDFEMSPIAAQADVVVDEFLNNLENTINLLAAKGISVILTLDKRLASVVTWSVLAARFCTNGAVVGYDLINEPFTQNEKNICWSEVAILDDPEIQQTEFEYIELIQAIRKLDPVTPIIVEPTFWAHTEALGKFPIKNLLMEDPGLIVSFHFYEPSLLTQRFRNCGRFKFPGNIPRYETAIVSTASAAKIDQDEDDDQDLIYWEEELILKKFEKVQHWAKVNGVQNLFCGEFGICRETMGAASYLKACFKALRELGMTGFLFSFRDDDWEAMDYELGPHLTEFVCLEPTVENGGLELSKVVMDGMMDMHNMFN